MSPILFVRSDSPPRALFWVTGLLGGRPRWLKMAILLTAYMLDVSSYHIPVVITPNFDYEGVVMAHYLRFLLRKSKFSD